jgi:RNA polymerase sigma-70 factor, ECF subfamily
MTKPDDASLLRLIAQAQIDAFGELYERYKRLVFSVAYAIVDDHALAEEITLDVFVRVWQHAKTYRPERAKVSTWLVAITRHHAIDIVRWRKSHPETNSLGWDEISLHERLALNEPQEQVELSLERERIHQALAQLSTNQREALALAYFRGYSHVQIAEALQEPLGTIKTRIRTALQKLRQILQED